MLTSFKHSYGTAAALFAILVTSAAVSGCSTYKQNPPTGMLVLHEWRNDENTCGIPIDRVKTVAKSRWIDKIPGCQFDFFSRMTLDNVPSATELEFDSFRNDPDGEKRGCSPHSIGNYRLKLKTFGSYEQTEEFTIQQALATPVGAVVVPGVRLLERWELPGAPGAVEVAFACLIITPST